MDGKTTPIDELMRMTDELTRKAAELHYIGGKMRTLAKQIEVDVQYMRIIMGITERGTDK